MGFTTEFGVQTIIGKQAGFGTLAAGEGRIVPLVKGARGPTHERAAIANDARYQDGMARKPGLGNPISGSEMQVVPNLDILGWHLIGFLGGFTDGATVAGLTPHTGTMGKTVIYHTIEENYENNAAVFYQYMDQVYAEYDFEFSDQGIYKPSFKTVGSGALLTPGTSFDATPTEVAGTPAEMLNWSTAINGGDEACVSKLTANCKREVLAVWVSTSTGMKCIELKVGPLDVTGTMTCLYKNDTMWGRARAGTEFSLDANITRLQGSLLYSLAHNFPEITITRSVSPEKQSGQVVQQSFEFGSHKTSSANAPLTVVLTNGTATHNS